MLKIFRKRPASREALAGWLDAIIAQDNEAIGKYTQKTWIGNHDASVIDGWSKIGLKDYLILSKVDEISRAMHKYTVSVRTTKKVSRIQLTVIKERKAYRASAWFGRWGVNPSSWRLIK